MVRKPLVRFETSDRAQLISASNSMPSRKRSRTAKRRTTKGRPRLVNGRVSLRVSGFSGTQRIPPSALIPYLPVTKLRAAAKRALNSSKSKKVGSKKSRRRRTTKRRKR
jgi:hypothetical protein